MAEFPAFDGYLDTSYANSQPFIPAGKLPGSVKEEAAPYLTTQSAIAAKDVWRFESLYLAFQEVIARAQEIAEPDIPDIFTLRPLATQQITLHITAIKPARFYYVPDMDDEVDDEDE